MNRLSALSALVLAAGLAFVPAVHAQWKWKDPSGVVQYSDRPPPQGTAEKDILQRPNPRTLPTAGALAPDVPAAAAPVAAADAKPGNPADDRRRQAEKEDAARKAAADEERSAKVRADNCQRARGQLRGLEDGARMSRVNEKGEREFLDDAGRAEETRRMREIIASDCSR